MDRETAIPFDSRSLSGEVTQEQVEEVTALDKKDEALASLFKHPDWFVYEDMVQQRLSDIRQLKGIDISSEDNATIGEKFRVANLAADEIDNLLLRVKEAARAQLENE